MPAGISALAPSSEAATFDPDRKDPLAFTILQKDGLDSSLPLLHPNDDDDDDDEAMMRSSRFANLENTKNNFNCRKRLSKSNDHLLLANLQSHQVNPLRKKQHSKSQDNLENENYCQTHKLSMPLSTEDFNDVLNAKLRKIQEQEEAASSKGGGRDSRRDATPPRRKPFITTVKTGEFLMPPPEVAALLGFVVPNADSEETADGPCPLRSKLKPLVSFGKRPEVRHSSHNARCRAALKATVDFTLGSTNATSLASSLEERIGRSRTRRAQDMTMTTATTTSTLTPRGLPKKLQPIEGVTHKLASLRGEHALPYGNIMFDRRVVRGSTFAAAPALIDSEQSIAARQAEAKRRYLAKRRAEAEATRAIVMRAGSPPPVPGRKHEPVQTELFLEEIFEKPDEFEAATQTDYFLDRPETPRYCPAKTGEDASTQIEPGDLFDFDLEVQPILEVLVGKTIEQALIEVLEEEEVAALKEQQRRFLELRAAEKAEAQRLEEQERRLREEKDRRLKQHEDALKVQRETEDRVAAAVLLTGYIAELLPAVLEGLKLSGFLLDEIKADVEEGFMPWLMKEVKKEMGNMIESKELLMEIIREILENRAETYRRLGEEYDASREKRPVEYQLEDGGQDIDFLNYEPPLLRTADFD